MRRTLLLPLLLAGCITPIPEHLRIESSADQDAAQVEVTDLRSALTSMVARDPLVRSPRLLDETRVEAVEGGMPVAAWIRTVRDLERGEGQVERSLQQLEERYPATVVAALSRGYRLRHAENRIAKANAEIDLQAQHDVVSLLTSLRTGSFDDTLPLPPLAWLGETERTTDAVRAFGERWVLTGWLQGPDIPVDVIATGLAAPLYDGLVKTPTGALLLARIEQRSANVQPALEQLERATLLALQRAAADRSSEQGAWADTRKAAAEELGLDDPVVGLLQQARDGLTAGAADPRAAGGALLAISAMRWEGSCGELTCAGVDRVETMRTAGRWSPELEKLSAVWQVIALKEALDTMDVGHATVMYPKAMTSLVDALVGTGAGPLDLHLLRRRSPDPSVWLALGRAVGADGITDWTACRAALGQHLESRAEQALALSLDSEMATLVERISARAVP